MPDFFFVKEKMFVKKYEIMFVEALKYKNIIFRLSTLNNMIPGLTLIKKNYYHIHDLKNAVLLFS